MKSRKFRRLLIAVSFSALLAAPAMALADDVNVKLCNVTADAVLDAAKARDSGVPEATYLSRQGVNG
jgi:hypothetical protein